jgi:hypothetical protein
MIAYAAYTAGGCVIGAAVIFLVAFREVVRSWLDSEEDE